MLIGYHTGGLPGPLAAAAKRLKDVGYDGIQLVGPLMADYQQRDAWEQVPAVLDEAGVTPICLNVGCPPLADWTQDQPTEAMQTLLAHASHASRAQIPALMVCPVGPARPDDATLRATGHGCARWSARMHDELGVRLTVHQHHRSPVENLHETRLFTESFDGRTVAITADTAHLTLGGIDPAAFMREFAERIDLVHIKDVRDGRFAFPGTGEVQFEAVFASLAAVNYDRALVADVHDAPYDGDLVAASYLWMGAQLQHE